MRYFVAVVLFMLTGIAFAGGDGQNKDQVPKDLPLNKSLSLRVGEDCHISGSRVSFRFVDVVEDSRCPVDALCIQSGTVKVRIGMYLENQRSGAGKYKESDFSLMDGSVVTPLAMVAINATVLQ